MRLFGKILLIIFLIILLTPVLILGSLGFIPGLSPLLGADKPKDLGVRFTQADLTSVRTKSQIKYEALGESLPPTQSRSFSGSHPVTTEFSEKEIAATLNNQPWKYWPYKNVQVKFNADGTGEISGILIKSKIPGYAATIGIPPVAADFAMKYLPSDPIFYVKIKAALTDNKVSTFEPRALSIGRLPVPIGIFLSFAPPSLIQTALAQTDYQDMTQELSKVQNKKALIINYINSRLKEFTGFYAKSAYFGENKIIFDGTLSDKILYSP